MVFNNLSDFSSASIASGILADPTVVCMALSDQADLLNDPYEMVSGDVSSLGLRNKNVNSAFFFENAAPLVNSVPNFREKSYLKEMTRLRKGENHLLSLDLSIRVQKRFILLHFGIFYSVKDRGYGFIIHRLVGLETQINGFYQRAQLDFTTGLLGKQRCLSDLNSLRLDGKSYVVFIDMNDFKRVNDYYGHEVGDSILKSFAESLMSQVENHYSFYRFGGDEFVVIASHTNQDELVVFLDRAFSLFKSKTPYHISVAFSAGAVRSYSFLKDHLYLLRCSDQAMYLAKKKKVLYYIMSEKEARESVEKGLDVV
jgi:diguanylate cyclase (GGDEF)-like protein